MKTSTVNKNDIFGASLRFDPSFHLSEGVKVRSQLHKSPYGLSIVGDSASDVFYGNIFSRVFVKKPDHGVPYLAASETVLSDINTGRYLSKKQANQLSYLMLKKDWILVTCSGTLGNVTYTNKIFENHIATHDLIRIIPNDRKVNKGTLYAFLSGKYGYYQITQSQFGGVVKHINESHMRSIIVPNFPTTFQKEVDDLIQQSAKLREQAAAKLDEAKELVNVFCNHTFKKTDGFKYQATNASKINSSYNTRIDAPYFINDGVEWTLSSPKKTVRLGDLDITSWYPGIFKRIYVQNGYPYIKGSSLFETNPFRRCDQLSKSRTPMLDQLGLKEGMLMMSCAGICGQVKMITKEYEEKGAIGSPDIIRLISNDSLITTEYLFVYFQLPAVYDFLQSLKYGSVIERFDIGNIENTPIVEPSKELSAKTTELVKQYMDCTYRAFCAEEKAITMVEQEIEKWQSPTA